MSISPGFPFSLHWSIAVVVVSLFLGCSPVPRAHLLPQCLDETDLQRIRSDYLDNPEDTAQMYLGRELCLEIVADFVDRRPYAVGITLNFGYMVSTLFFSPEDDEAYQRILVWADEAEEGDRIRTKCTLTEFKNLKGSPKPMVIPNFDDCRPIR